MKVFTVFIVVFLATSIAANIIQFEPSEGILIPAPVAEALRFARSTNGGIAGASALGAPMLASSSYAYPYPAPAPPPSYSGSTPPPSYSARAPLSSYSAPAPPPSYSAPAPPPSPPGPYKPPSYRVPPTSTSSYSESAVTNYLPQAISSSSPDNRHPPPCPKNYLFSCQSSITPVPCDSLGVPYAGAHSHHVPQYAYPLVQELY